jgi:nucleoid-associated protein YgaU
VRKFVYPVFGVVSLILISLAVVLQPYDAGAIQGGGIGGVPANPRDDNPRSKSIFVYKLERGENVNDAVQVINNTDSQKTLLVYAVDSLVASSGGFTCAQKAEEPIAAGTWINLAKDRVTLAAHAKENVSFTLNVPDNATPGEQNGCIVIQDASSAPVDQGNGIKLSFRSAIRVAVTIPGKINKDLSFTGFNVAKLDDDSLRLSTSLKNNGNVSLDTDVQTKLRTLFGTTARSAGGQFPVLADSDAKFNFEVDKFFWGGWYKAKASAEYNSDPAKSIGEDGSSETIYSDELIIFVAPQPLALAIEIAVLIVVAAAVAYFIRRDRYYKGLDARSAIYTVKPGDTINRLAKASGIDWKKLARLNGLKPPYTLRPGTRLKIPKQKTPKRKKK